MSKMLNVINCN